MWLILMVMSILLWKCETPCLLMLRTDTRRSRRPVLKNIKGAKTPWMTSDLKNAMRDRDFHHEKAKKRTQNTIGKCIKR